MNCKYLTVRSKNYKKYKFCRLKHKRISNECLNCLKKEPRAKSTIRKKSTKLIQLEKKRDAYLNKKGNCAYCGKYCEHLHSHEIYGGSNRQRSIKNGFVILLCPECHRNNKIIADLKIKTQKIYETTHSREDFIKIIGKSYLK